MLFAIVMISVLVIETVVWAHGKKEGNIKIVGQIKDIRFQAIVLS